MDHYNIAILLKYDTLSETALQRNDNTRKPESLTISYFKEGSEVVIQTLTRLMRCKKTTTTSLDISFVLLQCILSAFKAEND